MDSVPAALVGTSGAALLYHCRELAGAVILAAAAAIPTTRSSASHPCCALVRGRKAAARREALVDGSAACDPGTPGSVRWCGQAKGTAAVRYFAAPVLQAAARSDEVARADLTRWLGAERIQFTMLWENLKG